MNLEDCERIIRSFGFSEDLIQERMEVIGIKRSFSGKKNCLVEITSHEEIIKEIVIHGECNYGWKGAIRLGQDRLEYLEMAMNYCLNPTMEEIDLLEKHMQNVVYYQRVLDPILQKYDFYEIKSSLLGGCFPDNSSPSVILENIYDVSKLILRTDLFDKKFYLGKYCYPTNICIDGLSEEEFERLVIENFIIVEGEWNENLIYLKNKIKGDV